MYQTRNVNICQKTFLEYFQFNLSLSYYKKKKKIQNSIKAWKDYAKLKKNSRFIFIMDRLSIEMHQTIFNPFSIKHTQTEIIICTKLF